MSLETPAGIRDWCFGAVNFEADEDLALPLIVSSGRRLLFTIPGIGRLLVDSTGPTVVEPEGGVAAHDIQAFIDGPVAAAKLIVWGEFPIRGSAVDVGGAGVVISGPPGFGASTLAAAMVLRGNRLIADQLVSLDSESCLVPAHSGKVVLWPDSAEALGFDPLLGSVVRPQLASRSYSVRIATKPTSTRLFVLLERLASGSDDLAVERLHGHRKLAVIAANVWHRLLIRQLRREGALLEWAGRLARSLAVVQISIPEPQLAMAGASPSELAILIESLIDGG